MPFRCDAADDGGAYQYHYKRAMYQGFKNAHYPLIARKQIGHASCGDRINREKGARHVYHARQYAVTGHVQSVIVSRRQIQVSETAVAELGRELTIAADQIRSGEAMSFGLESSVSFAVAAAPLAAGQGWPGEQLSSLSRAATACRRSFVPSAQRSVSPSVILLTEQVKP